MFPFLLSALVPLALATALTPTQSSLAPASEHFSCGPCLLQPSQRGMTVVIDHEQEIPTQLRYWPSDGDEVQTMEHAEAVRHHVYTLEGLESGTAYSYEVTSAGLSSGVHEFRTLPNRPESYRVLVMGDVRTQPDVWASVSGRMFREERDALFAIGTGDYPSDGRKYEEWIEQFYAPARDFLGSTPLWPALGNHEMTRRHDDVTNIEHSKYFSLFDLPGNERWYRVDTHLVTLLVLDTNSRLDPEEEQYKWLLKQLRSARNRFTMVALHHAPLTSGPHGRLLQDGTPAEWPLDQGRRFLVPLFEMYAVDLVLGGHDHLYERSEKDGITYLVTGGGGAPLYKINSSENPYQAMALATHHYVTLDIDAYGIGVSAIDQEGLVFDSTVVPSTPKHEERRRRSVAAITQAAMEFGAMDPVGREVPVVLSNPFDQALEVEVNASGEGHPITALVETLAPGERREISWALGEGLPDFTAEPWRTAVKLELRMTFQGADQALIFSEEERRTVTVYRPTYGTRKLEETEVDGDISEWMGGASMRADGATPIVRNSVSYTGEEDFGAEVKFAWRGDRLYFMADITDDMIVARDSGKSGELENSENSDMDASDCMRLVVDVPSGKAAGTYIFTFGARGRFEASAKDSGVEHAIRQSAGGWNLEASVPLGLFGIDTEASAEREVLCDLVFVDRDIEGADASPSYHRFWTKTRRISDTSTFGRLVLED